MVTRAYPIFIEKVQLNDAKEIDETLNSYTSYFDLLDGKAGEAGATSELTAQRSILAVVFRAAPKM